MRKSEVKKHGIKSCAKGCGTIFQLGQPVFFRGNDRLGRPEYLCDKCARNNNGK